MKLVSKLKHIVWLLFCLPVTALAQGEYENISEAERPIAPAYRISEKPKVIDTIIPIPNIEYPLLNRNMQTEIQLEQIEPTKIKIIDKLDKLYPGYVRLGIGNYTSPLAEFYYNSVRNRRMNYGVHMNHNSSFGNIRDYAPSTYDLTTGKVFGEFFTKDYQIEAEFDYLNHGYHYYGLIDTLDLIPKDSLKNRVQGIGGTFKFSNFTYKDSAKLLYTAKIGYDYFHDFKSVWDSTGRNARSGTFMLGTDLKYKHRNNVFTLGFDFKYNKYKFAEADENLAAQYRRNDENALVHFRPVISTSGEKWRALFGVDLNFDVHGSTVFKVVPVLEAKYSLFNDMFIPYVGINGGMIYNTYDVLNRQNEFMRSSIELRNTREFKAYAGIKGTLSRKISFNIQGYKKTWDDKALFVNDTVFSDGYMFDVIYDKIDVLGIEGSFSYQLGEKLKIDAIGRYNSYIAATQEYAWHLPEIEFTLRGNYNLYDKIYIKTDFNLESGRMSPVYLFNQAPDNIEVDLGLIADANLHLEYRYNSRLSGFLQFNNLAAQRYKRWHRYPVQGFQVMGGITFGF